MHGVAYRNQGKVASYCHQIIRLARLGVLPFFKRSLLVAVGNILHLELASDLLFEVYNSTFDYQAHS